MQKMRLACDSTVVATNIPKLKTKKVNTAESPVYQQLQEIVGIRCKENNHDPNSPLYV